MDEGPYVPEERKEIVYESSGKQINEAIKKEDL
jgi:hypothetical protein